MSNDFTKILSKFRMHDKCWPEHIDIAQRKNICKSPAFFNGRENTIKYINSIYPMTEEEKDKKINSIPDLPKNGCQQVVFGTLSSIAPYFYHNQRQIEQGKQVKFIILSAKNWTEELNMDFVQCAFFLTFTPPNCPIPIRFLIPNDNKDLTYYNKKEHHTKARITLKEVCDTIKYSNRFIIRKKKYDSYTIYYFHRSSNQTRRIKKGRSMSTRRHRSK